jgi:excisionase family DNA binding protein
MILPPSLYSILRAVVRPLSAGQGVTILPVLAELTTQQAAEQLGMSRPSLIKLLEGGEMPFHRSGTHRRIYLRDLLLFKGRRDAAAARSVDELAADAQELGIYDE